MKNVPNGMIHTSDFFTEILPWYCSKPGDDTVVYLKYLEKEGAVSPEKFLHLYRSHLFFHIKIIKEDHTSQHWDYEINQICEIRIKYQYLSIYLM
jgi:hypothetical protein